MNFFAFHGGGLFVHLHDVAHYYLGAKYYGQLGNADLYTAMLRAESEWYDDRFTTTEARDLDKYDRIHIRALLERSDPVKAKFTPERWAEFQRDVSYFREALGRSRASLDRFYVRADRVRGTSSRTSRERNSPLPTVLEV